MVHFFPTSFPDETLYSRMARYHRLAGHKCDRSSLLELIGKHTHVITSDLPSSLGKFISQFPAEQMPSVEEIIEGNTIYPYFREFIPEGRCAKVLSTMSGDSASGIKMYLGLVASRLGAKSSLRYCRSCLSDDEAAFGQPYWHRVHQLPGAWVCPIHDEVLFTLEDCTLQLQRHKLHLPDDSSIREHASQPLLPIGQHEAVLRITRLSERALLGELIGSKRENLSAVHRSDALQCNLFQPNGRIRISDLCHLIDQYVLTLPCYGEYLIMRGRMLETALTLLRKPKGHTLHPLKHILLLDCLRNASTNEFFLNHVDEVGQPPPSPARGRRSIDQGQLIELIESQKHSLSSAAAVLGLSVTTVAIASARAGLSIAARPKRITSALKDQIKKALIAGNSIPAVAATHGVSPVSVYRILRMDVVLERNYKETLLVQTRNEYRHTFVSSHATPRAYAWLRRHDCKWLAEKKTQAPTSTVRKNTVDWELRDEQLAQRVIDAQAAALLRPGKPRRISRTSLELSTKMADTIVRNIDKLPLTLAALLACSESSVAYQRRRLNWAAEELDKELHGPYPRWRLLRQAGIRKLLWQNEDLVGRLTSLRTVF